MVGTRYHQKCWNCSIPEFGRLFQWRSRWPRFPLIRKNEPACRNWVFREPKRAVPFFVCELNIPAIRKTYTYWKLPVVAVFIGLIYLAVTLHSERWISVFKGMLFFSDQNDEQQVELIGKCCFYTVPILSVLFLIIRNRIANITVITLMVIHVLLVFPFNYIDDLTMNF